MSYYPGPGGPPRGTIPQGPQSSFPGMMPGGIPMTGGPPRGMGIPTQPPATTMPTGYGPGVGTGPTPGFGMAPTGFPRPGQMPTGPGFPQTGPHGGMMQPPGGMMPHTGPTTTGPTTGPRPFATGPGTYTGMPGSGGFPPTTGTQPPMSTVPTHGPQTTGPRPFGGVGMPPHDMSGRGPSPITPGTMIPGRGPMPTSIPTHQPPVTQPPTTTTTTMPIGLPPRGGIPPTSTIPGQQQQQQQQQPQLSSTQPPPPTTQTPVTTVPTKSVPPPLFPSTNTNTNTGPTGGPPTGLATARPPPTGIPGALVSGIPGAIPSSTGNTPKGTPPPTVPGPTTMGGGPPRPGIGPPPPTTTTTNLGPPPTTAPVRQGPPLPGGTTTQPQTQPPRPTIATYNPQAVPSSTSGGGSGSGSVGSDVTNVPSGFAEGSRDTWGSYGGMSTVPNTVAPPIDPALNCDPRYMSLTVGAIPTSASLVTASSLPFGLCVHPLAKDPTLKPVPLVDFGSAGVIRCKRCRTYINPFAVFTDQGRRWRCNMCMFINDVPHAYHGPIDELGRRLDAADHPELSSGSVDFVAPVEYMVRPPQPPVYVFVIDVSFPAVSSGVVHTVCAAIKKCLGSLPGGERTQVGFVTYNTSVHFYNLRASLSTPLMIVVPDITDIFMPIPEDLLVNLSESRALVDQLLDALPKMHTDAKNVETCLGTALDAAFNIMQHIGGKMVVCQTSLPSFGKGKLKHRENPKLLGTDTEHTLFAPDPSNDAQYYKHKAVDFSRQQISVDTFLIGNAYLDVATVGCISRYTAGHVYHYTQFSRAADAERLTADIVHDLTRDTGFEAVMRIRCTRGLRVTNFYGNFFIRGTDLLALPNVTEDTAFNVELAHEEVLTPGTIIGIQAALLYTTSTGERRINVHSMAAPVSQLISDLFKKVDVNAVGNMLAKLALDNMLRISVPAARLYLHKAIVDIIRSYKGATGSTGPSFPPGPQGLQQQQQQQQYLPESLMSLPLMVLGLQKCVLFRGGTDVKSDERSALVYRTLTMPTSASKYFITPLLLPLHRLEPTDGRPQPSVDGVSPPTSPDEIRVGYDQVKLPTPCARLSVESLSSDGAFLAYDGVETILWLGRAVPPQLLEALFGPGVTSLDGVDTTQISLQVIENDYSHRVNAIINALHSVAPYKPNLVIVREGSGSVGEARFHWRLIEDRTNFHGAAITYADYLAMVIRESQTASALH